MTTLQVTETRLLAKIGELTVKLDAAMEHIQALEAERVVKAESVDVPQSPSA